ncbi:adenylate/guanylate cyclase domain-containing protein [Mycolicibacterium fluoranthenivorans]|uniref:Adenylate cyclase, class 3 n=1 Tax=Mycolicibacterium fluoranthenivorans TaxID=258505 RepID=A0A1G4V4M8_9MYCO|nr:adenylate/guanylate cyclase domain-containing protein [Mycolicibacterium fluoranthenivorans]SCX01150.1 Adenylate cyclase, class 3 [Mycolicibacterium fluoranthenivorans]
MTERPGEADGEISQLVLFFADLVDSTALSARVEPETYRLVVGRYREQVVSIVRAHEGQIGSTKGDGLLAVFGHPTKRDDDAHRAVQAGLEITRVVARISDQAQRRFGFGVDVRVGVHRGAVYLDAAQNDFSGSVANVASGISAAARPGAVAVSEAIAESIRSDFGLVACAPAAVKGVDLPVVHYVVSACTAT